MPPAPMWCFQTYHMTRPAMTAAQVTQQVSGLLVSSSISLQQQHWHTRYTARTSRLRPRPTAPTKAREIRDWGRVVVEEKRQMSNVKSTNFLQIYIEADVLFGLEMSD